MDAVVLSKLKALTTPLVFSTPPNPMEIWTTKANMPTARDSLTSSVVNNKIYVIGGYNGSYLSTNEMYDPNTNTWTTKANMPTGRRESTSSVVNNKIYVIGGSNGSYLSTNEMYEPCVFRLRIKAGQTITTNTTTYTDYGQKISAYTPTVVTQDGELILEQNAFYVIN